MKTSRAFLISTVFLFISFYSFADGTITIRSKCRWWQPKYKVVSRVWFPLYLQTGGKSDCSYAYKKEEVFCALQATWVGDNGYGSYGWVSSVLCGRGLGIDVNNSPVVTNAITPLDISKAKDSENTSFIGNHVYDYKSHSIILKNLNGYFSTPNNDDFQSEFEIIIWKANDDTIRFIQDTLICENKVLWRGKAIIKGGKLIVEGKFDMNDFKFSSTGGVSIATMTNLEKNIPIDKNINLDDIVINISSHGFGKKSYQFINDYKETEQAINEGKIQFNTTLNKRLELVNIAFTLLQNNEVTVSILDNNGELLNTVYTGKVNANTQMQFDVDVKDLIRQGFIIIRITLSNGTNYLLVETL